MKSVARITLFFAVAVSLSFFMSCQTEDDTGTADLEIPDWLQRRIENDEAIIATDSTHFPAYGAWAKYEFREDIYFEYKNPVSSLSFSAFFWDGSPVNFSASLQADYQREKCCKQYVWQAPKYVSIE